MSSTIGLRAIPGSARYEILRALDGCTSEFSTSTGEARRMKERDRALVVRVEQEALERIREIVASMPLSSDSRTGWLSIFDLAREADSADLTGRTG